MKNIILNFVIFIILGINTSYSQWVMQYQVTSFTNLYNVEFANANTGWTSGINGLVLKTTNQGQNWTIQNTGITNKQLYGLSVVDSNYIYCAGWFETIIKTTNGGENWIIISDGEVGNSGSYFTTYFINKDTGWVCGTGQKVLRTFDGGNSFDTTVVTNAGFMNDIYFRNPMEGLICADGGTIHRTTNGGDSWEEIIVPVGTEASDFNEISVIDSNIVYTQGVFNNKVYKSIDFGLTWDSISRVPFIDDSYAICFVNKDTGWVGGSLGFMLKTTNGGMNWFIQNMSSFNQGYIRSLYFVNDTTGWAVGAATKILFTNTGGDPKVGIQNISSEIPDNFILEQNYPNPFNPTTTIRFHLKESNIITLKVYDILGQEVSTLVNQKLQPGSYEYTFDGNNLSSGIYFYKLVSGDKPLIKKFILTK